MGLMMRYKCGWGEIEGILYEGEGDGLVEGDFEG